MIKQSKERMRGKEGGGKDREKSLLYAKKTLGNVSIRLEDERYIIFPSKCKNHLREE